MKKIVSLGSAVLVALAIAGSAQSADLKAAPAYKAAPAMAASSWTGFYAGFGLGFRASRADVTTTSEIIDGSPADFSDTVPSLPFDGVGFRTSPYLGFNWQFTPRWVAGIEGDVGFANQTTTRAGFNASPATGPTRDAADSLAMKATWDASVRGRLGYLLTPATMAYATGGIAWQRYELTSSCVGLSCINNNFTPPIVTGATTKLGWTVGGGLETALSGHWLARAEYRYADLGSAPFTIARSVDGSSVIENIDVKLRTHTATFGLAYKFGDPVVGDDFGSALGAFAMAQSPKIVSWTGFYAGLGLGARASRTDLTTTSSSVVGDPIDLTGLSTRQPLDGTGFRASPYGGFNWQFAPRWVAGAEGDIGFASQTATLRGFQASPVSTSNDPADSLVVKTKWDASLRGRLGFLFTPATLAYATGGAAWQHFEVISTCGGTNPGTSNCPFFIPAVVTNSSTRPGWTIGGGLETALWGHWLARGEYRYADFGTAPLTIARTSAGLPIVDNFDVKLRTHTVSFGLAYKFN